MVAKGCESGNDFALQPKRRRSIRNALLNIRNDLEDRSPKGVKCPSFRLLQCGQVSVNFVLRHEDRIAQ